ncbi:MAG TPA: APC family permease [Mycobacteriales bacterium]|nr:APC family permease [Mycobacteriales bacterium]
MNAVTAVKRAALGRPLRSDRVGETLLPKWLALPVFCSDPLSSVAYATEATLAILAYGGVSHYSAAPWIGVSIAALLVIVVLSYRQTIHAYPQGGGAYNVSKDNLGRSAALTAASALLVDYVMTVTVSVAAGVAAITSAAPSLSAHAVLISVGFVVLLVLVNLRGVKESGKAFAAPTYGFCLIVFLMFAWAGCKLLFTHEQFRAVSAGYQTVHPQHAVGLAAFVLVLRAFANGCTALTGVEAVSNGVPAFRKPATKNAAGTLSIMAFLAVTMFLGITLLALRAHVHAAEKQSVFGLPDSTYKSALAQIGIATFGAHGVGFYLLTVFTCAILVLAANTAFNGFPVLASILAHDQYLPRQLRNRGDRLVFSNGVLILSGFSIALLVVFSANVATLLQLYIIGVFVSFTLSQVGMVRHWQKLRMHAAPAERRRMRRSQAINSVGAAATALVLVIVLATKLLEGAWISVTAMAVLFVGMHGVHRHYDRVTHELEPDLTETRLVPPARVRAIVLVSKIHRPTLRALAYARATHPYSLEAVTVASDPADADDLLKAWGELGLETRVPLRVLASPYRDVTRPLLDHVAALRADRPRDVVVVYVPEYVVGHWWEHLLHNQTPLRIKARLLFEPGVMVTSVPYQLRSSDPQRFRARESMALAPPPVAADSGA